jgi:hypothetical protein
MITRVSSSIAEGTSMTIPTHNPGDLIICFAFRDGSTTNPTIGTGSPTTWTSITNTTDGTSCSVSMAWKRAATSAETTGTWTNASGLIIVVYRGILSSGTPIGTFAPGAGTTNTVNYAARNLTKSNVIGDAWFMAFAAHRAINTTLESPPAGMSFVQGLVGTYSEYALFDTNAPASGNWPSTNVTITGTASGWQTEVIEIKAEPYDINNYKFAKSTKGNSGTGNTGIISFSERIQ